MEYVKKRERRGKGRMEGEGGRERNGRGRRQGRRFFKVTCGRLVTNELGFTTKDGRG